MSGGTRAVPPLSRSQLLGACRLVPRRSGSSVASPAERVSLAAVCLMALIWSWGGVAGLGFGADMFGAGAEGRQPGRQVADQRDAQEPPDRLGRPGGAAECAGEQAVLEHPGDFLGEAGRPLTAALDGGEVAFGERSGGQRAASRLAAATASA